MRVGERIDGDFEVGFESRAVSFDVEFDLRNRGHNNKKPKL
jgi:hypothetical protein